MARPHDSTTEDSRPDSKTFLQEVFRGPVDIRSIALTGIFLLFTLYSLYFARDFLLPVVVAFVLSFLFAPAVRCMARLHVPRMIGAAIIIAGLVSLSAYATYRLSEPAQQWLQKAPMSFNTI